MSPEVKAAVITALRLCQNGFATVTSHWSVSTGLGRWKRFLNNVAMWLGADQVPFIDPNNFERVERKSLASYVHPALIEEALFELSPPPECRKCGSGQFLEPDPAGYYCHAERYDGAPLLCGRCAK